MVRPRISGKFEVRTGQSDDCQILIFFVFYCVNLVLQGILYLWTNMFCRNEVAQGYSRMNSARGASGAVGGASGALVAAAQEARLKAPSKGLEGALDAGWKTPSMELEGTFGRISNVGSGAYQHRRGGDNP